LKIGKKDPKQKKNSSDVKLMLTPPEFVVGVKISCLLAEVRRLGWLLHRRVCSPGVARLLE
jgi:hypothetical protein